MRDQPKSPKRSQRKPRPSPESGAGFDREDERKVVIEEAEQGEIVLPEPPPPLGRVERE